MVEHLYIRSAGTEIGCLICAIGRCIAHGDFHIDCIHATKHLERGFASLEGGGGERLLVVEIRQVDGALQLFQTEAVGQNEAHTGFSIVVVIGFLAGYKQNGDANNQQGQSNPATFQ